MLTRLKVNGFKNLVDVDVRFGPFTCIAGVNGSGKSNLFDAIRFLAALAEKPLVEAALSIVRGESGRSADIRSLFHRVGDEPAKEMSFEAEMIIPPKGVDDLGQPVKATSTFLRYRLDLAYVDAPDGSPRSAPLLRVVREELEALSSDDTRRSISFSTEVEWWLSAIREGQERRQFIWTTSIERRPIPAVLESAVDANLEAMVGPHPLHGFAQRAGRVTRLRGKDPKDLVAEVDTESLPRTLLSLIQAIVAPEVTLTRQEMRSWRVLLLDPAAMRIPDDLAALLGSTQLGNDGSHLAATLYSVANAPPSDGNDPAAAEAAVYARIRNRLFQLIGEMREITVERDDKREELTLYATGRDGTTLPARALSDGTLRFLALAVLEQQEEPGLYCIEEPENGIHPGRIQALLDLLQAIATDTRYAIEAGNPLRQVMMSTHSPSVVMRVPADSLVVAELWPSHDDRGRFKRARFRGLANTWRDPSPSLDSLALGTLLDYLNPEGYRPLPRPDTERDPEAETRVMDHADIRRMLSPTQPD